MRYNGSRLLTEVGWVWLVVGRIAGPFDGSEDEPFLRRHAVPLPTSSMLIYATTLRLNARLSDLLSLTAIWLTERTGQHWSARRLLETPTANAGGSQLAFHSMRQGVRSLWAMRMQSYAARVAGRVWQLEVSLREDEQGGTLATALVHVHDNIEIGGQFPPPALATPELVLRLLDGAQPYPDTPGLALVPLQTREDANALVTRAAEATRSRFLVVACPSSGSDELDRLPGLMAGRADVALLRSPTPESLANILQVGRILAFPGRALILAPAATRVTSTMTPRRLAVGATLQTINAAFLKMTSPTILKTHFSVEDLKRRSASAPPGRDSDPVQALL